MFTIFFIKILNPIIIDNLNYKYLDVVSTINLYNILDKSMNIFLVVYKLF